MAISALAVWEARSTADATNVGGGFFVPGASGVDYSQQNSPQWAITGATSAGAGDTILTASADANMVGNGLRVISGTNFTTGWYEIIAVSAGVSIQVDRAVTTGAGASGVVNVGGAMSLGSSTSGRTDANLFSALTAGNTFYIKSGTYSSVGNITTPTAGTATDPIKMIGYNTTRGETPVKADCPILSFGANGFSGAGHWMFMNLVFTGTGVSLLSTGNTGFVYNCYSFNLSTTTGRTAIATGTSSTITRSEAVSIRGTAISLANSSCKIYGSYIHDSNIGIVIPTNADIVGVDSCIVARHATTAISETGTLASGGLCLTNNTVYGWNTPRGTGVLFTTPSGSVLLNNIITGFATGVDTSVNQTRAYDNYNDYYNNTADVSSTAEWQKGADDLALDPSFTNVAEIYGTTATTSNTGNTLTDAGATFVTSGVTTSNYVLITSSSGTLGHYQITSVDSETQLTLSQAPGASTGNVAYRIGVGLDFSIGTNLKAKAIPKLFGGSSTTSYVDTGGVQRQESGGGGLAANPLGGFVS